MALQRKYYQITELGKEKKEKLVAEWNEFAMGVNNLLYNINNADMEGNGDE